LPEKKKKAPSRGWGKSKKKKSREGKELLNSGPKLNCRSLSFVFDLRKSRYRRPFPRFKEKEEKSLEKGKEESYRIETGSFCVLRGADRGGNRKKNFGKRLNLK